MTLADFSFYLLLQDRLALATYAAFVITIILFYFVKHYFLRGVFVFVTLLMALYAGRLEWIALPVLVLMGIAFYYSFNGKKKVLRGICFFVAILLSLVVTFVRLPGIHNWPVVEQIILSQNAIPYTMVFNLDKSFIGLFFVWFSLYSLANGGKWLPALKKGAQVGVVAVFVLMALAIGLKFVAYDLKIAPFFALWAIHNLFFVCLAEEAFFRGMIQRFLQLRLQNVPYGKWFSLGIAALLFGLAHFPGGLKYMFLATVAGVFYGYAFMKTDKIEASVLAHFMVNAVHIIGFTYPMLASN